ncbi:Hypothetical protein D9617_14g076570 [Elsinoe fawcettii]|nr:Hypothetical protein D9617_14g076570 [Elsinoe fawcettii]
MTWTLHVTPEVDAQSSYPRIFAIAGCFTGLMLAMVGVRFWVRARIVRAIGADDWVVLASAFLSVVYSCMAIAQSRFGLGLPVRLRPKQDANIFATLNFACRPIYNACITGFKVGLCLAYLRLITQTSMNKYRLLIWGALWFSVLAHIAIILALFFYCDPVQKAWIPSTAGQCLKTDPLYYGTAAVTILCDIMVFFLPVPLFLSLQTDRRRKVTLIVVFLLGLITTVCSFLRMMQIRDVSKDGDATMLVTWAMIEQNVGIITTSLPALGPLIRRRRKAVSHYHSGGDRSGTFASSDAPHRLQRLTDVIKPGHNSTHLRMTDSAESKTWSDDRESQENILASRHGKVEEMADEHGLEQIRRTVDVSVHHSARRSTGDKQEQAYVWH